MPIQTQSSINCQRVDTTIRSIEPNTILSIDREPPLQDTSARMAADLNLAQREAVKTLAGPLLVLAGAGTGKTRVVTYRIAELIRQGTRPNRILAVTFTKKAAAEMLKRTGELLGKRHDEQPEISTFHALCMRILRRGIRNLGYPENFAIYDRGDQEGAARSALREIRAPSEKLRPADLIAMIGRWKMMSIGPQQAAQLASNDKEHLGAVAYRRYQQTLKTSAAVDFDDLLLLTEKLFQQHPDVRRREAKRFSHLLIDEYQDTNASQYRIVGALAERHRNLCVVGDDDQSIYGWRGADVSHILNFQRDWPDAKIVRMEDNYRSTGPILAMANRLIAFNKRRHGKVLRAAREGGGPPRIIQANDEEAEAREVVEDIQLRLQTRSAQPRDIAILFRTNEQPRAFEDQLRRCQLPYVLVGGMSFYDRKEVRDTLAYIKLLAQPKDDVALLRVINTPPRGIGKNSVSLLQEECMAAGDTLWDHLAGSQRNSKLAPDVVQAMHDFRRLIESFRKRLRKEPLAVAVTSLIQEIGYQDELRRIYPDDADQEARWNAVGEVVNILARFEQRASRPTLSGFLAEVALAERDTDDKDDQLSGNRIALLTLHSAKGLEFPVVYLVGLEEGLLPHRRAVAIDGAAIDEERRLCYVGVTRAQDHLTLSLSLTRRKWGKSRPTLPSRFLFELTGKADNPQKMAKLFRDSRDQALGIKRKRGRSKSKQPNRRKGRAVT